jgi:hypothetical protein
MSDDNKRALPPACPRGMGRSEHAAGGETRDAVLHMAQVWERLAKQHAHSTVSVSASDREQPALQQQQQVPPDDDEKE